jgi:glycosidase
LVDQIDVIAKLGVDTLWLTPIFASPQYHGYAVSDFLVIAPELGGQDAWKARVGRCRQRSLRIVLDFVANHISDQHAAFQQALLAHDAPTRPWLRFRTWPHDYGCFFDQPHQPELDGEQPEVREHLISAAVHWLGQGCAGFRLDYADGLSHGFWSQFRQASRRAASESVCFGEVTHTPFGLLDEQIECVHLADLESVFTNAKEMLDEASHRCPSSNFPPGATDAQRIFALYRVVEVDSGSIGGGHLVPRVQAQN